MSYSMRTCPVRLSLKQMILCACLVCAAISAIFPLSVWSESGGEQRVLVVRSQEFPAAASEALMSCLRKKGVLVTTVDAMSRNGIEAVSSGGYDAVVLCGPKRAPWPLIEAVKRYAGGGGHLAVLGGPIFDEPLWEHGDEWLVWDRYVDQVVNALAERVESKVLLSFEKDDFSGWGRGSGGPNIPASLKWEANGANGTKGAFSLATPRVEGWETFASPVMKNGFPDGHTLTTFWARGNANTPKMSIEWTERDGSRWYAKVRLSTEWRFYALPPGLFQYWPDNPSKGRGWGGDSFHPQNAMRVTLGIAFMYDEPALHGPHQIWLDELGAARQVEGVTDHQSLVGGSPAMPVIEGVCPAYKFFPVTNLARQVVSDSAVVLEKSVALPGRLKRSTLSHVARPGGAGIDKEKPFRYISLLDCQDAEGRYIGSSAALWVNGSVGKGMTFSVPVTDYRFFSQDGGAEWCADVVARMLDGLFLSEGGARWYVSFGKEQMPVGATVINRGKQSRDIEVLTEVRDQSGKNIERFSGKAAVAPGAAYAPRWEWGLVGDGPFEVEVTLREEGQVLDRVAHEVRVWKPKEKPVWVTTHKGDFYLDGKKWYPHGVNYMPSSGVALEDNNRFEYWVGDAAYDPVIIERDLEDIAGLGFNMVSIFVHHRSVSSRNLLDLLMRCEDHGLKANVSLRPGTPMDFEWGKIRELLVAHRLGENNTVFAYDLAWEPRWDPHANRKVHDVLWVEWVKGRHGSIAEAEKAWSFAIPREDGKPTNPLDRQVREDGPWRGMVVEYLEFLNVLLGERYGKARELVKSVAPHQLVSFRMSMAGDPTFNPVSMVYDLKGLVGAVDIMEPEAYGRIGNWEQVKPGWFTAAYSRAVAPDIPVLWAEFGVHAWDSGLNRASEEKLRFQAELYDDFYKMAHLSGANGTVCWWFPAGYRVNERSDYGVINADRSWRPVSHVIKKWAKTMTKPRALPQPDVWIEFDRSEHVDGLYGIYKKHQTEFWKAIDAGKVPGLREKYR